MLACSDWRLLAPLAGELRDAGWGRHITYSRKVFVPLTHLCRDVCHYCTFARSPRSVEKAFLTPDDVLAIARAGAQAGCKEVLFTLGDKPEARYPQARAALASLGHDSTLSYLREVAQRVLDATGLLPHLNPGLMGAADLAALRKVAPSMGIMLETASDRLSEQGGAHFGSPDKLPARRLETIRIAGEMRVPLTTGILIGIGETRRERIDALLALRDLAERHGHIQEIIVQNFRAKPGTKMRSAPQPSMDDLCWTIAVARLIFGPSMSIQAPPNLYSGDLAEPIAAGINDWGGVSPVTPDHVNPEAPWPHLDRLSAETERAGHMLVERLTVYPRFIGERAEWIDPALHRHVLRLSDGAGLARPGRWAPGLTDAADVDDERDVAMRPAPAVAGEMARLVERALSGARLEERQVAAMFGARGAELTRIRQAADELRAATAGDTVTYVVTRNINYTNICLYHCGFCAFSKGKTHEALRGEPYVVDLGRDPPPRARSLGAWRDRSLHARRHPPLVHGRDVSEHLPRREGGRPGDPRACLLAARGHAWSAHAWTVDPRVPGVAQGSGSGLVAGHRGRDPGRRGPPRDLPRQADHAELAGRRGAGARGRTADHVHDHVRTSGELRALGAAPAASARPPAGNARLHRVRAAAVRAHGGAPVSEGAGAQGTDACARPS